MAQFKAIDPVEGLTGKWSGKSTIVMRRKSYKYPDGRVFAEGPNEAYTKKKRDYKRSPRTAAEQAQFDKWTSVCKEASSITHDPHHPRFDEMQARFAAQLEGEAEAKIGKRIIQFANFVRAVLMREE